MDRIDYDNPTAGTHSHPARHPPPHCRPAKLSQTALSFSGSTVRAVYPVSAAAIHLGDEIFELFLQGVVLAFDLFARAAPIDSCFESAASYCRLVAPMLPEASFNAWATLCSEPVVDLQR